MHLLVRESAGLDETAPAEDLGLAPAEVVVLSFSDSDLGSFASAWQAWDAPRPDVRLVPLARLRHPMSVDLFCDKTLPGTKAVLVRLLGGLDYWRYGCEEVAGRCRELGITLAVVAGDGRPDPRLDAYTTLPADDLAAIEALLDTGGPANMRAALAGLIGRAAGSGGSFPAPVLLPPFGIHDLWPARAPAATATAIIVCYRSVVLAGDTGPLEALAQSLAQRGLATTMLFAPSLKSPDAARWIRRQLLCRAPDVILNATAFSAHDDARGSPLDVADCPVLQVVMAQFSKETWTASARGLGAADLAMHVALPEMDGRISAGAISFKQPSDSDTRLGLPSLQHAPFSSGIAHAADLALAWAHLRTTKPRERAIALMLSTYPGRSDQIAHAVGLDGPASAAAILAALSQAGYTLDDALPSGRDLIATLTQGGDIAFPVTAYKTIVAGFPEDFRASVNAAWGTAENDPSVRDQEFQLKVRRYGNIVVALQPERGDHGDRKTGYHDPAVPPRHGYVALYLWLRHVANINALIHLGAHGTLEWLPGKAVALSTACAPQAVLGPVPVIYPFIVNDPGEAAQAKRRIGAITLGHRPPPLIKTELDAKLLEVERLVDEFSAADGFDPKRRTFLIGAVANAVERAGLSQVCGFTSGMSDAEKLGKIDAFLCDVKELSIRDGLHILDCIEIDAILRALDGRFIQPGPSGAPSRGRADVLPTGRNLYTIDPRGVPTQTALANGERAARAIMDRYAEDHGEWPRAIVMDLWGSATLRTGGEELATALALLGVRPTWDPGSFRVNGYEVIPAPFLDRPRVDVTLRISGLFRDMFATQLTLFDCAVQQVAGLPEDDDFNPLAAARKSTAHQDRIFGSAAGNYGTGVTSRLDRGDWQTASELGETYLDQSATAYRSESASLDGRTEFAQRVRHADAFVHIQDNAETDLLTGTDFAAHEGAFAAAAAALGNTDVVLYHGDTANPQMPKMRTLDEECARIVSGRAVSLRWIAGQMRHGFRGAAEIAATVDAAFAFAATSGSVTSAAFEQLYDAYLDAPEVANFILAENPAAYDAICARFNEAIARNLWRPRRNDMSRLHRTPIVPEAAQ